MPGIGFFERQRLRHVDRNRFLQEDGQAVLERLDRQRRVQIATCADHQPIGPALAHQRVEIVVEDDIVPVAFGQPAARALPVGIHDAHDAHVGFERADVFFNEGTDAAAVADHTETNHRLYLRPSSSIAR